MKFKLVDFRERKPFELLSAAMRCILTRFVFILKKGPFPSCVCSLSRSACVLGKSLKTVRSQAGRQVVS